MTGTYTCFRAKLHAALRRKTKRCVPPPSLFSCNYIALYIFFLSLTSGLSCQPSSRRPLFDPGIFSVWCTIIRPSLYSLQLFSLFISTACKSHPLSDSFSLDCFPFFVSCSFPQSFTALPAVYLSVLCCLSLNLSSSLLSLPPPCL